ncbi:MAG: diadenylate cyclase [Planctomycetota bacterium]
MFTSLWTRLQDLVLRLSTYSPWEVLLELAGIWIVVFLVFRFVQGTRAAGAVRGTLVVVVLVLLVTRIVAAEGFARFNYLYDRAIGLAAIGLIIVFQPELRRGLIRLGETPFSPWFRPSTTDLVFIAEAVAGACEFFSKARFGAIIVIERQIKLDALTEGGELLSAELSTRLLQTIFHPGTALHDLAVVIRGKVIHSAGVQLPMAEPEELPDPGLGARHRAAVGITKECDALVVVVSEETGDIRFAERGRLSTAFPSRAFRSQLKKRLEKRPTPTDEAPASVNRELEEAAAGTLADPAVAQQDAEASTRA